MFDRGVPATFVSDLFELDDLPATESAVGGHEQARCIVDAIAQ
jgi:hypothetical protein